MKVNTPTPIKSGIVPSSLRRINRQISELRVITYASVGKADSRLNRTNINTETFLDSDAFQIARVRQTVEPVCVATQFLGHDEFDGTSPQWNHRHFGEHQLAH